MTPPPIRLEDLDRDADGRRRSPSANSNRSEILPVLERVLPARGMVLEVASGTGEHAVFFARALAGLEWQPTERDDESLASITAWRARDGSPNLLAPIPLDLMAETWPIARADAIVAINLMHIAPWHVTVRLLEQAGRILERRGPLVIYGAVFRDDRPTAPSNLDFDARLREADPAYGVRRLEDVAAIARAQGLELDEVVDLPDENVTLVFRRGADGRPANP